MKRRAPWQARRIATQKALRNLPRCSTPDCWGTATGSAWGDASGLCPMCKAQFNAKARAAAPRET
jgi:hypothetical protein